MCVLEKFFHLKNATAVFLRKNNFKTPVQNAGVFMCKKMYIGCCYNYGNEGQVHLLLPETQ